MISDSGSGRRGAAALVVGNEILLGRTQDTNTLYLADFLMKKGIKLQRWVIVPDQEDQIITEMRRLVDDRFDLIFVSGGMGPTHDDVTVESISKALNLPLVRSEKAKERMISKWLRRNPGKDLPVSAEVWLSKMSLVPRGFSCIENDAGMAEGLTGEVKDSLIFILPGVPREYRAIIGNPDFSDKIPDHDQEGLRIEEIIFRGRESSIAGTLKDLQESFPEVEFGSYPQDRRMVVIRLTGRSPDLEKALEMARTAVANFRDDP
ncbi:MAG: competence/damage-inducible protein A [Thermoplasmatota archaeon]